MAAVDDYSPPAVRAGLTAMIDALGGWSTFLRAGQRVLIKPNLIARRFESQTHPVLIIELAKIVRERGGDVAVADSPAWNSLENNARSSGLLQMAADNGIPLFEFKGSRRLDTPNAGSYRHLRVAKQACQADVIINVPKLKTHQQLKLTAGIKNMFGCVPGKSKALWHLRAGGRRLDFGRMLVETFLALKPALTVIDAIDAMEGKGPINGPARHLGALIGSADGFAAELAACELVGCDPADLVTVQAARELAVGPKDLSQVQLLGADLAKLKVHDFKFPTLVPVGFSLPRVIKSTLKQLWLLQKERGKRPKPL
jgi:uncharacterized protein (DUF362 family)